jgi:hypothetical protein
MRSCERGRKGTGSNGNVELSKPVNKGKRIIGNNVNVELSYPVNRGTRLIGINKSTAHVRRLHPRILAILVLCLKHCQHRHP